MKKAKRICSRASTESGLPSASVSGSPARQKCERHIALVFAQKWLWESEERRTSGCEWNTEYLNDAVSMMIAYRKAQENEKADLPTPGE